VCGLMNAGAVAAKALAASALGAAGPLGKAFAEECARNIEASTQVRAPARRKAKKAVEKKGSRARRTRMKAAAMTSSCWSPCTHTLSSTSIVGWCTSLGRPQCVL
jgi:hypothetical protein